MCEDDPRWDLLKMSDKKKYFNEFLGELKKNVEIEKKAKNEANKQAFLKMLK